MFLKRRIDHLLCPSCGAGSKPWDISVLRDGKATRICRRCDHVWRPADDPPTAGGPYVKAWAEEHNWPPCPVCGRRAVGEMHVNRTVTYSHEDGAHCTVTEETP